VTLRGIVRGRGAGGTSLTAQGLCEVREAKKHTTRHTPHSENHRGQGGFAKVNASSYLIRILFSNYFGSLFSMCGFPGVDTPKEGGAGAGQP
jgi:hypothetical protein